MRSQDNKNAQHWDAMFENRTKSSWTTNPIVASHVMRKMTRGKGKFWLDYLFEDYLDGPIDSLLAVGCGDGSHELMIAEKGYARAIQAFDLSEVGIKQARSRASAKGLDNVYFSQKSFEQFCQEPTQDKYDLIFFSGSLHHVTPLELMLAKCARSLKPGGKLVFNEYVGDCYNIYPQFRVDLINGILEGIDPIFRADDTPFVNPTIDQVMDADPSESVRSALILQFLGLYFEFEMKNYFGGSLLHPIFTKLNSNKLGDGSPESRTFVHLLVRLEEALIDAGGLPHDFCFGVCIPKQK